MKAQFIAVIVFILLVYGCSRTCSTSSHYEPVKSPVDDMIKEMTDIPSYSIILFDMNTEGSYFKEFYHQYRIIKEIDSGNIQVDTTRWHQVSEDFFVMHMDHMGMEIASKGPDGKVSKTAAPPGYNNYIGNQQIRPLGKPKRDFILGVLWPVCLYVHHVQYVCLPGSPLLLGRLPG
jgi:hypothetical protein